MSENVQAVEEKRGLSQHWPVALLALVLATLYKPLAICRSPSMTQYLLLWVKRLVFLAYS